MTQNPIDVEHMRFACEVAKRAHGLAEPNPTVGCVIAVGSEVLAEGWTQAYGSDHAEVHAIGRVSPRDVARLSQATLYVSLEPCCHQGKTPPCTQAILRTGIKRVVVAVQDPYAEVAGKGIQQLRDSGVDVLLGFAKEAATKSMAPYFKLHAMGIPWVIAKWAMTLDGKIATSTGDSQWISSSKSREVVHRLRGGMDAIMVGIGTALADDPLLTARPAGARVATRVVVDSKARLPATSNLAKTAKEVPVLLAVGPQADELNISLLVNMGVEVVCCPAETHTARLQELLLELGARRMTNVLVEGGARLLGGLLEANQIDEVHTFVAPKLVGGSFSPIQGRGRQKMSDAIALENVCFEQLEDDAYIHGRVRK